MAGYNSRLKEFELQNASDRRRLERQWRHEEGGYGYEAPRRLRSNTLGPQEDVIERRRSHRNRVAVSASYGNSSRSILAENIFLLLLLSGSIYGIYRLCIYILNL